MGNITKLFNVEIMKVTMHSGTGTDELITC